MKTTKVWVLLITIIGLLCYSNIFNNEFLFDDVPAIVENGSTQPPIDFSKIFLTASWWSQGESGTIRGYRPLTTLSFAVNRAVHGLSVGGYHLVNLIIHIINSILVFVIILTLFNRRFLAGTISLLFAAHPIHTEAVTGIIARADELSALFVLFAFFTYIKAWQTDFRRGLLLIALSSICLLAGLASKESAACFILIIITYEICFNYFPLGKIAAADNKILTAKAVLFTFYLLITFGYIFWWRPFVTGQFGDMVIAEGFRPPGLLHNWPVIWRLTAFKAFFYYIKLLFWPVVLSGDYLYNQIPLTNQISDPMVVAGLGLFVGFLFLGTWALIRGQIGIAFGVFFFYATYIPLSNLAIPIGALVGERLLYLPALGFCVVIGLFFEYLYGFLKNTVTSKIALSITASLLAILIIGFGSRTFARNLDWKNPYLFFKKTTQTSPQSAVSHYSVAVAYLMMVKDHRYIERWMGPQEIRELRAEKDRGKALLIRKGLNSISKALEITKSHVNVKYLNIYGGLLAMAGQLEEAKGVLIEALKREPNLLEARVTLGAIYIRLASKVKKGGLSKRYLTESVMCLEKAMGVETERMETPKRISEVYFNLAIAREKLGRYDEALKDINSALLWLNRSIKKAGEGQMLLGRFYLIKAAVLSGIKDYERAINALEKAKESGFPRFRHYVLKMRQLRPLRNHPRLQRLIALREQID